MKAVKSKQIDNNRLSQLYNSFNPQDDSKSPHERLREKLRFMKLSRGGLDNVTKYFEDNMEKKKGESNNNIFKKILKDEKKSFKLFEESHKIITENDYINAIKNIDINANDKEAYYIIKLYNKHTICDEKIFE